LQFVCGRPDLVLLDIGLPDLDGWEVFRLIRATSEVPIVCVTAFARPAERERALRLGAEGYLTKPFAPVELLRTVRMSLSLAGNGWRRGVNDVNFHPVFTPAALQPHMSMP
jgi:DNA-binding response OmpR family regulator